MSHMGLVVFPLALVLLIQPLLAHDQQTQDITTTGLGLVEDAVDTAKETHSLDDIKNIGGKIKTTLESGGRNDKASDSDEAFLIEPELVKIMQSSPEIQSWLAEVFRVYRSTVGDAAVNAKGVASTLADLDVDEIKKMCEHVKEALGNASLKANVAISLEDEEKAIEFSAFLPVISMVNDGKMKPEDLKKLASSPEIKSSFAKFEQEFKSIARGAAEAPASVHLDIDESKMIEEQIKEYFRIGGLSGQAPEAEISPEQEEEFVKTGLMD